MKKKPGTKLAIALAIMQHPAVQGAAKKIGQAGLRKAQAWWEAPEGARAGRAGEAEGGEESPEGPETEARRGQTGVGQSGEEDCPQAKAGAAGERLVRLM